MRVAIPFSFPCATLAKVTDRSSKQHAAVCARDVTAAVTAAAGAQHSGGAERDYTNRQHHALRRVRSGRTERRDAVSVRAEREQRRDCIVPELHGSDAVARGGGRRARALCQRARDRSRRECAAQERAIVRETLLYLDSNAIKSANFSGYSDLIHVCVSFCDLHSVYVERNEDNMRSFTNASVDMHSRFCLGRRILAWNGIENLDDIEFNSPINELYLGENSFEDLNFTLPANVKELFVDGNTVAISDLENLTFPDSIETLYTLNLTDNRIQEFEIRASDQVIFEQVLTNFDAIVQQLSCSDSKATKVSLSKFGVDLCVVSDARFDEKYRGGPSTEGHGLAIGLACGGGGLLLLTVAFIVYRVYYVPKHSNKRKSRRSKKLFSFGATSSSQLFDSTNSMELLSQEYLSNDVRNDETLIPYRISQSEIVVVDWLASGGFGVIHLATYRGRDVAVKQMLPEKAKNMHALKSFMDEIRLCSTLEHPKIVSFIGIAWSNLLDVAVIIEYMSAGDLWSTLHSHCEPHAEDWFEPSQYLKSKNLLALDAIEALVYLHSFSNPIIHRDLKAKNVLLNDDGIAKLSDFGISREISLDETMTGEVGTVAWIAPEILQGERYTEKADIYSFGVLLVEMDTCAAPYAPEMAGPEPLTNTRIAMMVSAGKLTPSLTPTCPASVRELAQRCLQFNPDDRPSGVEIHYALRTLQH
ncbi:Tkl protein kinase, partial [Globisporangium splendens]